MFYVPKNSPRVLSSTEHGNPFAVLANLATEGDRNRAANLRRTANARKANRVK